MPARYEWVMSGLGVSEMSAHLFLRWMQRAPGFVVVAAWHAGRHDHRRHRLNTTMLMNRNPQAATTIRLLG